ncbi:MAG TPA: flagellar hook-length control protein FliK [Noviherbaspirillum sp.]|jgi:flagellar hook-length control protein FliK|uniref:flagellar hook-length control protein FliK n=1 Tax=Noviherbaspirillum sp. TaxID=1926288 RepID=UPI002F926BDC
MQTPQVSNPANALAGARQPGKQTQAENGTEAFGQALSREVAGRRNDGSSNGEPARAAADAAANRQPAAARNKPAEAKPAKGKAEEGSEHGEDAVVPADAQAQFSTDMLALVAAINSITAPAVTDTAKPATEAADTALGLAGDAGGGTAAQAAFAALQAAAGETRGKPDQVAATNTGDDAVAFDPAAAGRETAAALATATGESAGATEAAPEFLAALQESAAAINAAPAMPQLAVQAAQHASHAAADKLTPAVGTAAWDQALGQKVVWMVAGEQQSASLTLNPPDLGPLQVVLNVSNSHASATFTAAQPEVRQALEAALPKLREMLGEAGIQLGQASVNSGHPQQPGDNGQQAAQSRGTGGNGAGFGDGAGDTAQARVSHVQPASSGTGLVDTFA